MDALQRISAIFFYSLGGIVILGIVLVQRGIMIGALTTLLNVLDLPLLLSGMLFGGSSLTMSLSKGNPSRGLLMVVFIPLAVLFVVFFYLNFWPQFAEVV